MRPKTLLLGVLLVLLTALAVWGQSARTTNFVVSGNHADEVADACEESRRFLALHFLGRELPDWRSPALVTIKHGGGLHGGGTTSFLPMRGGPYQITATWEGTRETLLANVVPHEVCHLVLATHFQRPLPRWYDEGACIAIESPGSQDFQARINVRHLQTGRGDAFNRFLNRTEYPRDVGAFYAQSHSVAAYLLHLRGPAEYIRLGDEYFRSGSWDTAVQRVYGFKDVSDFQVTWNQWLASGKGYTVGRCQYINGRGWVCPSPTAPSFPARGNVLGAPRPLVRVSPSTPSTTPRTSPSTSLAPRPSPTTSLAPAPKSTGDAYGGGTGGSCPCPPRDSIDIDYGLLASALIDKYGDELRGPPGREGGRGPEGPVAEIDYKRLAEALAKDHADRLRGEPGTVDYTRLASEVADRLPPIHVELQADDGSRPLQSVRLGEVLALPPVRMEIEYPEIGTVDERSKPLGEPIRLRFSPE